MSNYFKLKEFECPCCGKNNISQELIDKLNKARELASIPFIITSGYRCEKHNKEVGGKPNSSHLSGLAIDILCNTSSDRYKIITSLLSVGFNRIGIGHRFLHTDIDKNKPDKVVWVY